MIVKNPIRAKRRLTEEYRYSDEHAEGLLDLLAEETEDVATSAELQALGERLGKRIDNMSVRIDDNARVMQALIGACRAWRS